MGATHSVAKLVENLSSESSYEQEAAVQELCNIAVRSEMREFLAKKDVIPPLVKLLASGSPKARELSAATLSHLALHAPNHKRIADADAMRSLVDLLRSGTPQQQGAAAVALINLSKRSPCNQDAMGECGAVPLLVNLLRDGVPRVKEWACVALGNVALQHSANQKRVAEAGGVEAMLKVIATNEVEVLSALCNVVGTGSTNGAVVSAGAIPVFVRVVTRGNQQTRAIAAGLLGSLAAESQACRSWIAEQGGIRPLVELAKNGCTEGKLRAVMALCVLAEASWIAALWRDDLGIAHRRGGREKHDGHRQKSVAAKPHCVQRFARYSSEATVLVQRSRDTRRTSLKSEQLAVSPFSYGSRTTNFLR